MGIKIMVESTNDDFKQKSEAIKTILDGIVAKNDAKKTLDGLELLLKLISNIVNKPTETKYRTVKSSIPKIQSTIFSLEGGVGDLLLAFGFKQTDAEHFVYEGDDLKLIQKGQRLTEKVLEPVRYQFMDAEQKKKFDLLQEQKAIYKAEM